MPSTLRRVETGIYVLSSGEYRAQVKRQGRLVCRNLGLVPLSEARAMRDQIVREMEAPPVPGESFSQRYERLLGQIGVCPIESGRLGALADNECEHGRLPYDRTEACGCWPQERTRALVAPRPQPDQVAVTRERRVRVAAMYEQGLPLTAIAAECGVPVGTINSDLARLRATGQLTARRNRQREQVAA